MTPFFGLLRNSMPDSGQELNVYYRKFIIFVAEFCRRKYQISYIKNLTPGLYRVENFRVISKTAYITCF